VSVGVCAVFFVLSSTVFLSYSRANSLVAYLQTKQFLDPNGNNYIELHFQYVGNSIVYQQLDSTKNDLSGELAVFITITKGDAVVERDAYRLTPIMEEGWVEDFYDIQRFVLQEGSYRCEIEIIDLNTTEHAIKKSVNIVVSDDLHKEGAMSDLIVAHRVYKKFNESIFSRSGYDIIPRISTFYPSESTQIPYCFEVYWANHRAEDTGAFFSVSQQILNAKTHEILPDYTHVSQHAIASHVSLLQTVDLTDLPTGSYLLRIATLDSSGNERAYRIYEFERDNDLAVFTSLPTSVLDPHFQMSIHEDSTSYYLASLIPISQPQQVRTILTTLKEKNTEKNRMLIQAFWKQQATDSPYESWMRYKGRVEYVQQRFKTHFQPGFETDRGRVYLQYGPPNRITDREVSTSEYPYEMWEYNKIGSYSNRKFIFYNPDLTPNTYRLLHSDMVGELKNPSWQYDLNSRNNKRGNVDEPNEYNPDSWGNNARQIMGR